MTLRGLYSHIKRHWPTVAFILGFIVDNLTLHRVDKLFDNIILSAYIVLAMVGMALQYGGIAERFPERMSLFFRTYAPYLIQYAFGGLLSGMLIFYGRSGALYESWPFILLVLGAIYGNETIKDRASRLVYNLTMFFLGMFSYVILVVPVVWGKMGTVPFLVSGALAIVIISLFIRLLAAIVPNFIAQERRHVVFSVGLVFVLMNVLYFTNVIPPIPLSLKDIGIYHAVVRVGENQYEVSYEKPAWWEVFRDSDHTFHYRGGESVYCFASVFAPTRLATRIYHRWERFDETNSTWVEHGRYEYTIEGGRDGGYRGYTRIENYTPGAWRCSVETERGQSLGRETFTIEKQAPGEFVTAIK